jgi:hypothetical protein
VAGKTQNAEARMEKIPKDSFKVWQSPLSYFFLLTTCNFITLKRYWQEKRRSSPKVSNNPL